jgi:hypothetical protein
MASEREWVTWLQPRLQAALDPCAEGEWHVRVGAGKKLAYACEIHTYGAEGPQRPGVAKYETDLLVYDARDNEEWVPRVVVECKSTPRRSVTCPSWHSG